MLLAHRDIQNIIHFKLNIKHSLLFIFLFAISTCCYSQTNLDIAYQKAFAKTYGYVKYFHPSDEASKIDWDQFAIYGAGEVEKCTSDNEHIATLKRLFTPLAPSIRFYKSKEKAIELKKH